MKRDFLNKILYTVMCVFLVTTMVFAYPNGGDSEADPAGPGGSACQPGSDVCAATWGNQDYVTGIRIMFYRADGTKISAKDYVKSDFARGAITVYGNGEPCGKIDHCTYNNSAWAVSSSVDTTANLSILFASAGYNINIDNVLRGSRLDKYTLFADMLNSDDINKGKILFNSISGKNADDYYDPDNQSYDIFLVWEPLATVTRVGHGRMVGTLYELTNYLKNNNLTYIGPSYTGTGWGGLGKKLTQNAGCSTFFAADQEFISMTMAKYPNYFSGSSYFNNKISLAASGDLTASCGTRNMEYLGDLALDNSSAYAIGVLWFDEIGNGPGFSCASIYDYYSNGDMRGVGSPYTELYINNKSNFDFSGFNELYGTNITVESFKALCPCVSPDCPDDGPGGYNCTPTYNVPNCSEGQILTYKDQTLADGVTEEYWQRCVFTDAYNGIPNQYDITPHKTSSHDEPTYFEPDLGSKYCEVYCIEEVYGNFDSKNPTVLAGLHFEWGYSTVKTIRTCRTKEIKWGSTSGTTYKSGYFRYDLDKANQAVLDAYAAAKLQNDIDNTSKKWVWESDVITQTGCKTPSFDENGNENGCSEFNYEHTADKCKWTGPTSATVNGDNGKTGKASISPGTREASVGKCSSLSKPSVDQTDRDYNAAIEYVERIIKDINKCYNFTEDNVLNDESKATITYGSDTYPYSSEMDETVTLDHFSQNDCTTTTSMYTLTKCSNYSKCSGKTNIQNCSGNLAYRKSEKTFTVPDGVYQYVLKNPNGYTLKSIHYNELSNYNSGNFKLNWIDIGYSNFPVPYELDTGYTGELKIEYSNLGHTKSDGTTDIDKILGATPSSSAVYGDWTCKYTVDPGLICDPETDPNKCCPPGEKCGGNYGGIRVIYREIDLYYPFPDTQTKNRSTGANWCDSNSCAWNNETSTRAILKNRNVTSDDLYDLDPMYVFEMTPTDILEIRRYNNSYDNEYSKYTGQSGSSYYDFICIEGTGRGCRSEYLSHLLDILDSDRFPGTCKNDRQVYQTEAQFEKCRY